MGAGSRQDERAQKSVKCKQGVFIRYWSGCVGGAREEKGVKRGGGRGADLFAVSAIDGLNLGVGPLGLGGATAPTPVDGTGFLNLEAALPGAAPALELLNMRAIAGEVFLHYRVR